MDCANRLLNLSRTVNCLSRNTEWIAGSFQLQCHLCHRRQRTFPVFRQKKVFHTFQPLLMSLSTTLPKENQTLTLGNVSPQGIQGDIENDRSDLWLKNCRRYGLGNCDQQLVEIQSGRKTVSQVIAEQDNLIANIAKEYQKQSEENSTASVEGVNKVDLLPNIDMPCPQGVQGEDCARFKLWLENCHQFRFGGCLDQLESYQQGRKTLAQLLDEQDLMIREAATVAYQKRKLEDLSQKQTETTENEATSSSSAKLSAAQKLRNAVAVYGSTVMVFHISISLMSLGFFYTLVSSGIDVVGILSRLGIGESIIQNRFATGTGTFVVAYAVHKIFAPVRIAATLTATPLIVRYLRRIGFLKTPPKK